MGRGYWGVSDHHQPRRAEGSQLRASGAVSWWPRMEWMDQLDWESVWPFPSLPFPEGTTGMILPSLQASWLRQGVGKGLETKKHV